MNHVHRDLDVSFDDVAEAHRKDREIQGDYDADFKEFWFDEDEKTAFCLFEAPDAETGERVHREAHGLTAQEIHEVRHGE